MINPVHQLLLARLDSTPAPTVSLRDLLPHPEPLWRPFLENGVLAEADTPDEIEIAPTVFLNVRKVGGSYFGFDTSEDYPTPQPLSREDITEYRIVISALLTHLRDINAVDGRASASSTDTAGIHAIGRRATAGDTAQVWLALALGSPDAIAAHLSLLAREVSHGRHLVVFPLWPDLPVTTVSSLSSSGVLIADLDPSSLAIRWPASFTADPVPETHDCALTSNGATWRIDYLGETIDVPDSIGINYIALLMSTRDGTWTPFELQAGRRTTDAGTDNALNQGLSVRSNTQADLPRSSARVSAEAELTLRRFAQEIEKLRDEGRETEADELQEQATDYTEKNAHLLSSRARTSFEGDHEKARLTVRGNIKRALKAIENRSESLGRIIRDRVHISPPLSFSPARGESWVVRLPKKIRTSRPKSRK